MGPKLGGEDGHVCVCRKPIGGRSVYLGGLWQCLLVAWWLACDAAPVHTSALLSIHPSVRLSVCRPRSGRHVVRLSPMVAILVDMKVHCTGF